MNLNDISKVIEKVILCPICGKRFKTESWKKHHILMNHTNDLEPCKEDGLFHCPLCPKRYKNRNSRSHHIVKNHCSASNSTDEEINILQCQLCKATFANTQTLNLHLKLHAICNSKKKKCDADMPKNITYNTKSVTEVSHFVNKIPGQEFDYNPSNAVSEFSSSQLSSNDQFLGIQNVRNQVMDNFDINLQAAEELAHSSLEKDQSTVIIPGQIVPSNNTWSPQNEQKLPDVGFYNDLASIMALSDSSRQPSSELGSHSLGIQGSLNTYNPPVNYSLPQLHDMSTPSSAKLTTMPDMYGSNQSFSAANYYYFNTPSTDATTFNVNMTQQQMLCANNNDIYRSSVEFSEQPTPQQAQQYYTPDQLMFQNFPTFYANNINPNGL